MCRQTKNRKRRRRERSYCNFILRVFSILDSVTSQQRSCPLLLCDGYARSIRRSLPPAPLLSLMTRSRSRCRRRLLGTVLLLLSCPSQKNLPAVNALSLLGQHRARSLLHPRCTVKKCGVASLGSVSRYSRAGEQRPNRIGVIKKKPSQYCFQQYFSRLPFLPPQRALRDCRPPSA